MNFTLLTTVFPFCFLVFVISVLFRVDCMLNLHCALFAFFILLFLCVDFSVFCYFYFKVMYC